MIDREILDTIMRNTAFWLLLVSIHYIWIEGVVCHPIFIFIHFMQKSPEIRFSHSCTALLGFSEICKREHKCTPSEMTQYSQLKCYDWIKHSILLIFSTWFITQYSKMKTPCFWRWLSSSTGISPFYQTRQNTYFLLKKGAGPAPKTKCIHFRIFNDGCSPEKQ
jgi:hypothetical protein